MAGAAALLALVAALAVLFWLGWRSMSKRELLPPEPEPEPVALDLPPSTSARAAGVLVASVEVTAALLLLLAVVDALGYRPADVGRWGMLGVPWIMVGLQKPRFVLDPLRRLWAQLGRSAR